MSQLLANKLKKLIVSFLLDSRIPLTYELYLIDFQKIKDIFYFLKAIYKVFFTTNKQLFYEYVKYVFHELFQYKYIKNTNTDCLMFKYQQFEFYILFKKKLENLNIRIEFSLKIGSIHQCPDRCYRVCSLISKGTYGKVYLCQDEHGNKLAMKLFQEKLDMEVEIDALSKLKKIDGVVQIVDVIYFNILGVDFGAFTMLYMEYTLKSYVEAFNPKEEMIIEVFYELLCILKDLHANCVIHCDMKQENVLLTEDSRICLADFGISKILPDGIHMIKINDEIVTSWFQCPINSLSKANNEPFIVSWIADLYGLCVSMLFLLSFEISESEKKFNFLDSYLFHIFRDKNYFEIDEDEDEDEDHKSKKKIDIKGSTEKIHNACSIVENKFFRELLMACMDPESILGWYVELEIDPSNNNSIIPKIIEKIEDYFGWGDTPPRPHAIESP